MVAFRAFYVAQDSLAVWQEGNSGPEQRVVFAAGDSGLQQFDAYLAQDEDRPGFIVVDVIEEEFAPDTMPKLGMRDRTALMHRRMQRKFPGTPFRLPVYQGSRTSDPDEARAVYSAVTNHELLDPWLEIILRRKVPLAGIFSVPLLAPKLLHDLYKTSGPALFVTQHCGRRLRQVFMQGRHVLSARLSQSPALTDDDYPQFVLTEIGRSRRYLERARLFGSKEQLDVYIVAEASLAERLLARAESDSPLKIHFIKPDVAAKRAGMRGAVDADRLESLYLAHSLRQRTRHNYAVSGECRFWHMRRLRHAIVATAVAVSAACAVLSGLYLSDAWSLNKRSADVESQLVRLTESFRRENEQFDPIKADSHEMKLAVDTGDFILSNRLPAAWVMQQVGLVMGSYPDVQILSLAWSAESATPEAPARPRRGEPPRPVPVPEIALVRADITADIRPFDGNMRRAFSRIDALVSDLRDRTAFSEVVAVEYPFDTRPQSSLSGEIAGPDGAATARFRLRLRLPLNATAAVDTEANDDSV